MPNQVTLTFAGETKNVEQSFDRVGGAAKKMSGDVEASSEGFRRAGEAADEVDTKAMGFRDTLTGVQDTLKGTSMIMKGPSFEGFVTLGAGIGDLGSGFYNFLIPALEKTKIATLASTAASKVAAIGSKAWAAANRVLNLSFLASPITWIVLLIVGLIAVVVLIEKRTGFFSKAWTVAWGGIKRAASATWDFVKKIPGWTATAFSKIASFILAPYKAAFNGIARAWNATVGRLSFTVPNWIPGIGGNSFSVPNLPTFHAGGVVPGVVGTPTVAVLQAGERVSSVGSSSGDGGWVTIRGDGFIDDLIRAIGARVGAAGGQAIRLGIQLPRARAV